MLFSSTINSRCISLPEEDHALVKAFLKDNHFLIIYPGDYNTLGVGATQLYNTRLVYNHRRHGELKIGERSFQFLRKRYVPDKVTSEFLLVDLVNDLERLAEDQSVVMERVKLRVREMDHANLRRMANGFGKVRTRKLFNALLTK